MRSKLKNTKCFACFFNASLKPKLIRQRAEAYFFEWMLISLFKSVHFYKTLSNKCSVKLFRARPWLSEKFSEILSERAFVHFYNTYVFTLEKCALSFFRSKWFWNWPKMTFQKIQDQSQKKIWFSNLYLIPPNKYLFEITN